MENQEAIEILKDLWRYEHSEYYEQEVREALEKGIEALENRNSTIEELEKIREEIQGLIDFEEECCGNATLGYECLGVIKNKISELKGETK